MSFCVAILLLLQPTQKQDSATDCIPYELLVEGLIIMCSLQLAKNYCFNLFLVLVALYRKP